MWNLKRIRLKNIASHEFSEYSFNEGCTPIFGENRDKPETSNGSGKSSLYDAISIALLGEPIKNVQNKDIVRNGFDEGMVYLCLENPALKRVMEIEWSLYVTKSWSCKVTINNDVKSQLVDVNGCKEKILNELGISRSDLLNYFIVSRGNYTSFFKAKNTELEVLLNRFSKADKIDSTIQEVKSRALKKEEELKTLKVEVEMNERELLLLNARLDDAKSPEKLVEARDELVKIKRSKLESHLNERLEAEQDLVRFREKIDLSNVNLDELGKSGVKMTKELELKRKLYDREKEAFDHYSKVENEKLELRKANLSQLEEKLESSLTVLEDKAAEITEISELVANIESSLRTAITCPSCKHIFSLKDENFNAAEAEKNRKEGCEVIEELKAEKEKLSELLELAKLEVKEERQKIRSDERLLQTDLQEKARLYLDIKSECDELERSKASNKRLQLELEDEIKRLNTNVDTVTNKLTSITGKIMLTEEEIKSIEESPLIPNSKLVSEIQHDIDDLNVKTDKLRQRYDDLLEQFLLIERQESIFVQFKRHLASQCVAYLNREVNLYLEAVNEPTRLKLESQRKLANKKLKDEFNVKVLRGSLEPESIHKFSNGEMAILEIFVILTVQKFINQASYSGGLNFLGLDEICDGIDATNFKHVLKVLYSLRQTVMIVSHLPLNVHHDKCLVMVKQNGVTKLTVK